MKNDSYSSLKSEGHLTSPPEVSVTSPKSLREQIKARPDFHERYCVTPLAVLMDSRLTHADRSICDMIQFLGWPGNACFESTRRVADAAGTDQHQVRRSISRLVRCGHMLKRKDGALVLTSPAFAPKVAPEKPKTLLQSVCKSCGSSRPLRLGICVVCKRQDIADEQVGRFLSQSPDAPLEIVFLGLKSHSSKCNAKEIERAYYKWQKKQKLA